MGLRIFATGGTFDKKYDEINEKLIFDENHIKDMLNQARATLPTDLRTIMMIDSLDMTEQDRHSIMECCKNCKEDEIVVTHGTGTMEDTAKYIGQAAEKDSVLSHKTIVLTGAMVPSEFGNSDAMFNLGNAIAFAQALQPGVYIAMNGQYFLWNNVTKNVKTGRFERLSE